MEHSFVSGFHSGTLLYLHGEKHLFRKVNDRNGQEEWMCYESILPQIYQLNEPNPHTKCTAKTFRKTNSLRRNQTSHSHQHDHERVFRDLVSLEAMKEKCKQLAEWCPLSSYRIPAKEIFMTELAK